MFGFTVLLGDACVTFLSLSLAIVNNFFFFQSIFAPFIFHQLRPDAAATMLGLVFQGFMKSQLKIRGIIVDFISSFI